MDPDDWLLPRDVPSWCFPPEEKPLTWGEWFWLIVEGVASSARKVCSLLCQATLKLTILFISTVACGLIIGWFLNNETYTPTPSSPEFSVSYQEHVKFTSKDFDHHGIHRQTTDDKNGAPRLDFPEPRLLLSRNWKLFTGDTFNNLQSELAYHAHETWAVQAKGLTFKADVIIQGQLERFSYCQELWHEPSNMANEKLHLVIAMIKKKRDELSSLAQRMDKTPCSRCSLQQTTRRNVEALSHMAFLLGLAAKEQVRKLAIDTFCFQSVERSLYFSMGDFDKAEDLIPDDGAWSLWDHILADVEMLKTSTEFAAREASQFVSFFQNHLDRARLIYHDVQMEQENMSRWLENAQGPCGVSEKQIDVLEKVNNLLNQGQLLSQGTGGRVQM
ncbi:unnamed protein product [Clonostachys rhizophaga]|uniref:Uncharacterized protein n=1 Tax=Clonostachys rhizophaga TaxID=160324 RepID=A0A9N9VQD1_9HYPO|nr:unnamed protein product [Clonostachys rhizophaga]